MALRMPKACVGAPSLWRTVFLTGLIAHVGAAETPALLCHTDYVTEVVCQWDAKGAADCATEFRLAVRTNTHRNLQCVPEKRTPESASLSCSCVIPETRFHGTKYILSLVTGTKKSKEQAVVLSNIVKPRALRNLTVTKSHRHSFILNWARDYDSSHILSGISELSQVLISSTGQKHPVLKNVTEQGEHHEVFAQDLLPGKSYTARVRYKVGWSNFWSEWSSPCTWSNDFEPEPRDDRWWLILLVCFLVTVLVSACYFCLARLKQEWWDQVPSPAKSKVAEDWRKEPCPAMWQRFQGDDGKVPFCSASQNLLEKQRSSTDSPPEDGASFAGRLDEVALAVPGSWPRERWEAFLTPEVPSVEPSLTVCSPMADPGPGAPMEGKEDHVPRHDALADLFLDILGGGGSAEDAETPEPVLEEPPPARAPELALGGLCSFGGMPTEDPGVSSKSGYRNFDIGVSPQAESPAPEQRQGSNRFFSASQYKLLLFPRQLPSTPYRAVVTGGPGPQGASGAPTPRPSGYKSFHSLVGLPTASFHQPWQHQLDFPGVDQTLPLGSWPPSCGEGLFAPPQQEVLSQNAGESPCSVESSSSGYQPFRQALPPSAVSQDPGCLSSGSPYKPLPGVFKDAPKEGPRDPILRTWDMEREAWHSVPWEKPLTFAFSQCLEEEEEDSGQGGVRQRAGGFLPQVPIAIL